MQHYLNTFKRTIMQQLRTDIHYAVQDEQWVLREVAENIVGQLVASGHRAYVAKNPWAYRNQIIHFGDRYMYLSGAYDQIAHSNHVFMTWYHGQPDDPDPFLQELFAKLPAALPFLEKIVISCEEARHTLTRVGVDPNLLIRIPIGLDPTKFYPPQPGEKAARRQQLGIPENVFCIGSFLKDGRGWGDGMEPKLIKGPDIFLEVIDHFYQRHKNIMVLLTGPARGYVKAGLDKIGVPYLHRYEEDYDLMLQYYYATDVCLITSRSEGGPKCYMESAATRTPVVSTKMGMPADWIIHEESGLLADVEDVLALVAHLERLIDDAAFGQALAQHGLDAVQNYTWAVVAEQHNERLYQPILKRG